MARVYLLYALCNILTIFITLKWLHERKRIVTKEIIRYRYRNQLLNQPFTGSDEELRLKFQLLINKSVDALDEELVELARQVIEPPSERRTKARTVPVTPQIKDVIEILGKKVNSPIAEMIDINIYFIFGRGEKYENKNNVKLEDYHLKMFIIFIIITIQCQLI